MSSAAKPAQATLDVLGVGNAIVDVLAETDDAFLAAQGITKGAMTLIDTARAEQLYAAMPAGIEASGGSAANTMAGIASLGGKCAYIGKVSSDQLGEVFAHDIRAIGVDFHSRPFTKGEPTARCLILITPDAQRSMNTYLGASSYLDQSDLDAGLIGSAQITYLEGYLFDRPDAKAAFFAAAKIAHDAGRKVALTLSDTFCVSRHHAEFTQLVGHVDILFANEGEAAELTGEKDFDASVKALAAKCPVVCVTHGPHGSVIASGGQVHRIAAAPVTQVVDTTGAGDLYAAGVL
ncbi:MAG TPA: adenosine kinase, partial [Alphaproteobacteria bacterium]|nr:adenosine kinase [Alphaproteobacteria bacterium]